MTAEMIAAGASPFWVENARRVERERARLLRGYASQRPGRVGRFFRQHLRDVARVGALDLAVRAELARLGAKQQREHGERLKHIRGRWS